MKIDQVDSLQGMINIEVLNLLLRDWHIVANKLVGKGVVIIYDKVRERVRVVFNGVSKSLPLDSLNLNLFIETVDKVVLLSGRTDLVGNIPESILNRYVIEYALS